MNKKVLILTIWLWLFWVILTANFKLANLVVGLICSFLIAFACGLMLGDYIDHLKVSISQIGRLLRYIPFLIKEIVLANLDVAERVLDPELPISPVIIKFKFPLKEHLAQVTLANSITLTPGTLTVDVQDGVFYIHCLAEEHVGSIFGESLQEHVAWVFKGASK